MNTATDNKTVMIEERAAFGRFNYYVIGEHAVAVQTLTRKRTVDMNDVRALESLGFACRIVMPACEAMR